MGSIRSRPESGALFMDFKYQGRRMAGGNAAVDLVVFEKDVVERHLAGGSVGSTSRRSFPQTLDSDGVARIATTLAEQAVSHHTAGGEWPLDRFAVKE